MTNNTADQTTITQLRADVARLTAESTRLSTDNQRLTDENSKLLVGIAGATSELATERATVASLREQVKSMGDEIWLGGVRKRDVDALPVGKRNALMLGIRVCIDRYLDDVLEESRRVDREGIWGCSHDFQRSMYGIFCAAGLPERTDWWGGDRSVITFRNLVRDTSKSKRERLQSAVSNFRLSGGRVRITEERFWTALMVGTHVGSFDFPTS